MAIVKSVSQLSCVLQDSDALDSQGTKEFRRQSQPQERRDTCYPLAVHPSPWCFAAVVPEQKLSAPCVLEKERADSQTEKYKAAVKSLSPPATHQIELGLQLRLCAAAVREAAELR